ncbi:NAD(P)/FAD-dependent oxidoreductase [Streptomyces sp. NPDC006879]|uniref:NAD(P)/FAD-dependent oxidoreductase n=1 Tax=Streptomyces sp. NPDC006879 TaxID=3364767 RepID=UPI00369372FE
MPSLHPEPTAQDAAAGPRLVVVGGGFAGVWAAAAAARLRARTGAPLTVTLVSPGPDLVLRPRLYEAQPHKLRLPLARILGPVGVRLAAATVTGVDTAARRLTATGRDGAATAFGYDRLVLATGSALARPPALPGADLLHDVDTMDSALALDARLRALPALPAGGGRFTAVVVGSGFTGLEVATELVGRLRALAAPHGCAEEVRVVLVERADVLGPGLGPGPRPVIEAALGELRVETRLDTCVQEVTSTAAVLSDGTRIDTRCVVWTGGVRANALTEQVPAERDQSGRLVTDAWLRVPSVPEVYAAGDTAAAALKDGRTTLPSCQHAIPLGKHAGHNAAADLLGQPRVAFAPGPYVTCLDLGAAGAVSTTGWERTVRLRGAAAKVQKRLITERWIVPPLDHPAELLRQADHRWRTRREDPLFPAR